MVLGWAGLWLPGFGVPEVVWCGNCPFRVFGSVSRMGHSQHPQGNAGIAHSVFLGVFHGWGIPSISREMQELPILCFWGKLQSFDTSGVFLLSPGKCKISRGDLVQESPIPCVWDKTGSVSTFPLCSGKCKISRDCSLLLGNINYPGIIPCFGGIGRGLLQGIGCGKMSVGCGCGYSWASFASGGASGTWWEPLECGGTLGMGVPRCPHRGSTRGQKGLSPEPFLRL